LFSILLQFCFNFALKHSLRRYNVVSVKRANCLFIPPGGAAPMSPEVVRCGKKLKHLESQLRLKPKQLPLLAQSWNPYSKRLVSAT
jgi:hypothetical protein